ncbi:GDSL-like Lipase/Acylhydrolase superfamily protein [Artemisia annua]|uniref:GDSL-like Lipase/Acylhydrolase superfamily protein n=1 Tax=Artemisia annua TaxID=35608 RepID=A0A2U1KDV6_ARTAN|nr:GDSL-like Lipase/Acylhydrolase superfamily protein [Artemisia annua]
MITICLLLIFVTLLLPISILSLPECNFPAVFNFGDSNSDTGALAAMYGQLPFPYGETYFHHSAGRYSDGRLVIDFIECNFPAVFNFGDSNSDTGALAAMYGQLPFPYGETYFHHSAGRYSDGRLVIDFIEVKVFIRVFGTSPVIVAGFIRLWHQTESAGVQWCLFLCDGLKYGRSRFRWCSLKPSQTSKSVQLVSFMQAEVKTDTICCITTVSVSAHMGEKQNVYGSGGRTFWIHNTGLVGCLAYILDTRAITPAEMDKYGCAAPYNDVSQYFNQKLKEAVIQLRKEFPSAAITYVDIYAVKYSLIAQAEKLVCCGHGGRYNFDDAKRCGSTEMVNGTKILIANSCEDPYSRIIWDGIHFTEAANKWIYDQIVDGAFSDPPCYSTRKTIGWDEYKVACSTYDGCFTL